MWIHRICKRKRYNGGIIALKKYYELLGLPLDEVKKYFDDKQIKYTTTILQGKKDQDKLIYPKVIKIAQKENHVELFVTYFSGSLL